MGMPRHMLATHLFLIIFSISKYIIKAYTGNISPYSAWFYGLAQHLARRVVPEITEQLLQKADTVLEQAVQQSRVAMVGGRPGVR
jgi:hypothetical protein